MNLSVPLNARQIGECIYCGTRDAPLGTEHAVPYGLNGPWTLMKASCDACAKITHRFERDTMRSLWPDIRNVLAMQSRRRDRRSPTLPLVVQRDGVKEIIQVPRCEFPTYLNTPLFPPLAVFWSNRPIRGVFANLDTIHLAGPTFLEVSQRYPGAEFVGAHTNFSPEEFAKTVAKIGFCAAISALGWVHSPTRQSERSYSAPIPVSATGWARGMANRQTKHSEGFTRLKCNAAFPARRFMLL